MARNRELSYSPIPEEEVVVTSSSSSSSSSSSISNTDSCTHQVIKTDPLSLQQQRMEVFFKLLPPLLQAINEITKERLIDFFEEDPFIKEDSGATYKKGKDSYAGWLMYEWEPLGRTNILAPIGQADPTSVTIGQHESQKGYRYFVIPGVSEHHEKTHDVFVQVGWIDKSGKVKLDEKLSKLASEHVKMPANTTESDTVDIDVINRQARSLSTSHVEEASGNKNVLPPLVPLKKVNFTSPLPTSSTQNSREEDCVIIPPNPVQPDLKRRRRQEHSEPLDSLLPPSKRSGLSREAAQRATEANRILLSNEMNDTQLDQSKPSKRSSSGGGRLDCLLTVVQNELNDIKPDGTGSPVYPQNSSQNFPQSQQYRNPSTHVTSSFMRSNIGKPSNGID